MENKASQAINYRGETGDLHAGSGRAGPVTPGPVTPRLVTPERPRGRLQSAGLKSETGEARLSKSV